jgi:hypothetical protein
MAGVTRDPGAVLAMVSAYRLSQVVCAAAELELADELAAGPRSVSELAEAANAHEQTLARRRSLLVAGRDPRRRAFAPLSARAQI